MFVRIENKYLYSCCVIWFKKQIISEYIYRNANIFLFIFGCFALFHGIHDLALAQVQDELPEFDTKQIDYTTCMLYALLEGPYGALLTAVAGFAAVISAIMGSYQTAYQFLIVGIGCFTARSFTSMYFTPVDCNAVAPEILTELNSYRESISQ